MKNISASRHRKKRMPWLRTRRELIDLIVLMMERGYIGRVDYAAVIVDCFVDRDGNDFKPGSLRATRSIEKRNIESKRLVHKRERERDCLDRILPSLKPAKY